MPTITFPRAKIVRVGTITVHNNENLGINDWHWDCQGQPCQMFGANPLSFMGWPVEELKEVARLNGRLFFLN